MKSEGKRRGWRIALLETGTETLLRRVFLGGARLGNTGGPGSLGIVPRSVSPPTSAGVCVNFFPTHAGDLRGALSSVPSVSQFVGGKCAR